MPESILKTKKTPKSSMVKRRIQKFCKNPMSVIALIILVIMVFASVFAPLLTSYDPAELNILMQYAKPSAEHPLGCDRMGRDLLARILYGGRWSLLVGVLTSLCVNTLGATMGVIAGYFGGKVDKTIVTLSEFTQLFPSTLVLILIATIAKIDIWVLVGMWTLTGWPGLMRIIRSRVLSLKKEPFVESCIANGIPKRSIMFHHIIPNTTGPIIVNATVNVAGYILAESSLSYLGYGLDSSIPTWGNLLNATKNIEQILTQPIQWICPAACILVLVLCVNYLGDGLRDAFDATTR